MHRALQRNRRVASGRTLAAHVFKNHWHVRSPSTISEDLRNFEAPSKLKHAKTTSYDFLPWVRILSFYLRYKPERQRLIRPVARLQLLDRATGRAQAALASEAKRQPVAQIESLKEQIKFNAAEYERQIAVLMRDLTRAEYKLAQRELIDTFASAPSLSMMKH